jgi:hypothetical protein
MVLRKLVIHIREKEKTSITYIRAFTKINSNCTKDPNVKKKRKLLKI